MTSTTEIRLPFKPKILPMLLGTLFFAALGGFFLMLLMGDGAVDSGRLGRFAPETQQTILWILAGCSIVFVLLGLFGLFKNVTSKAEIVITDRTITAPKNGFATRGTTIRLEDLTGMDVIAVAKQRFLRLQHVAGKLDIAEQSLPRGTSVEDLFHEVNARRSNL